MICISWCKYGITYTNQLFVLTLFLNSLMGHRCLSSDTSHLNRSNGLSYTIIAISPRWYHPYQIQRQVYPSHQSTRPKDSLEEGDQGSCNPVWTLHSAVNHPLGRVQVWANHV